MVTPIEENRKQTKKPWSNRLQGFELKINRLNVFLAQLFCLRILVCQVMQTC